MPHRYENIDFKRTLASIPMDVREILQEGEDERNAKDFEALKKGLSKGECYLCGKKIEECDPANPCLHFLLNPRLKKVAREALFSKPVSFIHLYTYLAWVANTEMPFVNINDILSDIVNNRIFEGTIRYKNIEWSFTYKPTDLEGHQGAKVGALPHYHFQMKVDNNVTASFNNCHIQFTPYDFQYFEMIKQDAVVIDPQFASGLETLKQSVIVNGYPNGQVEFEELISAEERYITKILPGTISKQQIEEIGDIFSNSKLLIYQIIEKLNKEKGYSIQYALFSRKIDNPILKSRRD